MVYNLLRVVDHLGNVLFKHKACHCKLVLYIFIKNSTLKDTRSCLIKSDLSLLQKEDTGKFYSAQNTFLQLFFLKTTQLC